MANVTLGRFNPGRSLLTSKKIKEAIIKAKEKQKAQDLEAMKKADSEVRPSADHATGSVAYVPALQAGVTAGAPQSPQQSGISKLIVPGAIAVGALLLLKG